MLIACLAWIEATSLSTWVRESTSVLAFPAILSAHAIGMGLVAGFNAILALRLLGAAPLIPVPQLKRFVPIMWAGFWMNALSGLLLLIGYPTKALTNPLFYLKLGLIALGLTLFIALRRRLFADTAPPTSAAALRRFAYAVLVSWGGAIIAGRLLAYTYTRLMADWQ